MSQNLLSVSDIGRMDIVHSRRLDFTRMFEFQTEAGLEFSLTGRGFELEIFDNQGDTVLIIDGGSVEITNNVVTLTALKAEFSAFSGLVRYTYEFRETRINQPLLCGLFKLL